MTDPGKIATEAFDYHLPEANIPRYPRGEREESNLLVYQKGNLQSDVFRNLADHIPEGYHMVYNNARVVYARLMFRKDTGAEIEIFCLEPQKPADYEKAFQQKEQTEWQCLVGNLKKWKGQSLMQSLTIKEQRVTLRARQLSRNEQYVVVHFSWDNPHVSFGEILDDAGKVPIPPYLKRESEPIDKTRYQTVYSRIRGSVAAPTAGLHFTEGVFRSLEEKNITNSEVTLHVGAGTFRPVTAETAEQHDMHTEHFSVSRDAIEQLMKNHPHVLAVGTTTLRTLESLYWIGVKLSGQEPADGKITLEQWEYRDLNGNMPVREALDHIGRYMAAHNLDHFEASTRIMIVPGYRFKLTGGLITNFHQPKSTLLMLVAAFVGSDWKKIYQYALNQDFRFLSYGDSSLLFPKTT